MKAGRVRAGAIACAAVAVLALPATAAAKPGYEIERPSLVSAIRLQGSNGVAVSIRTFGHRRVLVETEKGSVFATYSAPGRVTSRGIDADLGRLGHISVRFEGVRKGKPTELLSFRECRGPDPVREVGNFRGVIRFTGEQRYTEVRASRAWGSVTRSHRRVCKAPGWPPGPVRNGRRGKSLSIPVTLVSAVSDQGRRSLALHAFAVEGPRRGLEPGLFIGIAIAVASERRGRIAIDRTALISFGRKAIALGDSGEEPRSATVAMPKPFGGSASYAKEPGAPASWTGSLGVWLPGLGTVPLTGPDFVALVCHSESEKLLKRCEAPAGKAALSLPQGSGSQSQDLWELRLSSSR